VRRFLERWEKSTPGGSPGDNPLLIGNEPLKDPSSAWNTRCAYIFLVLEYYSD
jgi:hypothetical protein